MNDITNNFLVNSIEFTALTVFNNNIYQNLNRLKQIFRELLRIWEESNIYSRSFGFFNQRLDDADFYDVSEFLSNNNLNGYTLIENLSFAAENLTYLAMNLYDSINGVSIPTNQIANMVRSNSICCVCLLEGETLYLHDGVNHEICENCLRNMIVLRNPIQCPICRFELNVFI